MKKVFFVLLCSLSLLGKAQSDTIFLDAEWLLIPEMNGKAVLPIRIDRVGNIGTMTVKNPLGHSQPKAVTLYSQ
jgi:hypothetical protein